ncbi:MAG: AraC family transcriptional regulator [Aquabacterium sp.]|uniref:AraC family transcriptional regulator n=1 Tax=Aquabacterium sp. TaxID=1872578 RepID=UPI00272630E8|nr:AraC family transcriptional regulator [Aquabacterium sp.]MDO9004787.1 AraC family transcriptional regulator [Aquabacterium sp.]
MSNTPVSRFTSLSSWVSALKRAVDKKGVDAHALMVQAGLDVALLGDPLARYPSRQVIEFWKLAIQATGDPLLGVSVSQQIAVSTFHALGFAILASNDLASMFERMTRYFRLVTNAGEIQFVHQGGVGQLLVKADADLLTPDDAEAVWCVLDAVLIVVVRACHMLYGPDFKPLELRLQRPRPARHDWLERAFLHVPIYGCAENALLVDEATLSRRLIHGNAELARVNEEATGRYLSGLGAPDGDAQWMTKLKNLLQERLPAGDPPQSEVAQALGLTSRTLQRKLADAGTTYRDVIHRTRQALALEYLAQTTYSVSEIAYLLGFAEVSGFTRAFRRWTGTSPSAWRAHRKVA